MAKASTTGPAMYWTIHKGTPPRPGTYRVFGKDNLVLGFAYWFGTSWGHTYYSLDLVQSNPSRKKLTASQIEAWAYCKPGKKSEIALSLTTLRGIVQQALASPVTGALHVVILTPTHIDGTPVSGEGSLVAVLAQNLHKPLRQWRNSTQDGSSWFEAVNLQKLPQAAGGQSPSCYIQIPAFVAYQHASLAFGMAKYGVSVRDNPLNLRQWLQHALEESLDQAVYLMHAIEDLDGAEAVDDTLSAALDYEANKEKGVALAAGLVQARIGGVK